MSSIVTSILSSTVGLLCNKVRDKTAESLKDGDITDAKLREIVVRELNDIKTKLDSLSRKDLLSSHSFLQEGIQLLNACLEKFEQKAVVNEGNDDRGETSRMPSGGESDILNEALQLSQALAASIIRRYYFSAASIIRRSPGQQFNSQIAVLTRYGIAKKFQHEHRGAKI